VTDWKKKLTGWSSRIPRTVRRPLLIGLGSLVILAGVAMLVLPGPAFIVIPLGLAILSSEVPLARRVLMSARKVGRRWWTRLKRARARHAEEVPEAPRRRPA
jgi:hypothetical protein